MLSDAQISAYAGELLSALQQQQMVAPLTERTPEISIQDAYQISKLILDHRTAPDSPSGETIVGKKIGVTSDAVQSMLGVYEPDFGFLTDKMQFGPGKVPIGDLIQPRAEAEIAFRLSQDLIGPGVTQQDVLAATECVMACFEIVDSRVRDWQIKIQDTVADNASCGVYVLGDQKVDPNGLDLAACQVRVHKNGEFLSEGLGSAVQGSPLQSIAWLANTFGDLGIPLRAGEVILSGSLVPLEPIVPGDEMTMSLTGIGDLSVTFVD
ncbi:MAG: 2-oxopent-4-enoate hydratase [Gammaproteobacteria bacterium]|nr:2-oxopent-4-enoate hydratase [Gammaproteobacteria bacterium]